MTSRLIQITDCHLFADPQGELKGIRTRARLESVLAALRAERQTTDRLIITGDLTHDDLPESYRALHDLLGDWRPIVRVLPGNHDDRAGMRTIFGDVVQDESGRNVFVDVVAGWRLIGLDSQVTGQSQGRLGPEQLRWLDRQLSEGPSAPTVLFLHHPPVPVGSPWVDRIGLEDAADFLALSERRSQVKLVCAGHVHQETTVRKGALTVVTTPATGVQFRPSTPALEVDLASPGYRVLELEPDGSFRTRVIRVT